MKVQDGNLEDNVAYPSTEIMPDYNINFAYFSQYTIHVSTFVLQNAVQSCLRMILKQAPEHFQSKGDEGNRPCCWGHINLLLQSSSQCVCFMT